MKVLPFNLNTTVVTRAKGEKVDYIEPGSHLCKITSITTSDDLDNYNGSPFIDFNVTSNNKVGRCRFWAVKQTDKPKTQEWKTKQIKDFLINAGVREHGLTYAKFIDGLKKANIEINRKILSEIAFHEPAAFKSIVEKAKANLAN